MAPTVKYWKATKRRFFYVQKRKNYMHRIVTSAEKWIYRFITIIQSEKFMVAPRPHINIDG